MNTQQLDKLLEELCRINGTSGREERVREYILSKISDKCRCEATPLGCIIAHYKGRKTPSKKLIISAHMDEVGLIATYINDDGTVAVDCVGGVNADAVIGRTVVTESGLTAAIGSKAIHNMTDDEKKTPPSFDKLYADIGAKDKADAERLIRPGDVLYYRDSYIVSADGGVISKAIDDRAGCAIMIQLILEETIEYDVDFTFVTQEEVGLRGARTAAFITAPDYAIVLEATTAADIPLSEGAARCCELGKGPVVSYMDRATIYDRELFDLSRETSSQNGLKWQTKTVIAGGNDSGAINISRDGVRTIAISVPCRYLHTPSCLARLDDFHECAELAGALANRILQ